jgi:carboxyl-terminal processing protease
MRTRPMALLAALILMVGLLAPAAAAQTVDPGAVVFIEAYRILRDEALAQPAVEVLLQGADAGLRRLLREEGHPPAVLGTLVLSGDERADVDQVLHRIELAKGLSRGRPAQVVHAAVAGMVAALRDPNSAHYTPEAFAQFNRRIGREEFVGVGIIIEDRGGQAVITDVVENSPASESGIRGGDVILAVDGVPTVGRPLEDVSQMIRGAEGTTVTLRLQRTGQAEPITVTITRRRIVQRVVTTRVLASGVGYLRLSQFTQGSDALVAEGLRTLMEQGARGIVLDMRGNPGGLLEASINIASHFLESGVVVTLEAGRGQSTTYAVRPRTPKHAGPLVVLVDRGSASASEVVAGALQDAGVRLIGTRTYGKATVQAVYRLRDGSGMRVTISRYLTPAGRDIEGHGLTPDVEVTQAAPIGSPDDAPLNRAVAALTQAAQLLRPTGTP